MNYSSSLKSKEAPTNSPEGRAGLTLVPGYVLTVHDFCHNSANQASLLALAAPKIQGSKGRVLSTLLHSLNSSRFKVQGSKFKVQGSKFKVQGSKFKVAHRFTQILKIYSQTGRQLSILNFQFSIQ